MTATALAIGSLIAIAVYTDLRYRRIPNLVLAPFTLLGPVLLGISQGWTGVWESCIGFGLGLILLMLPYLSGGIGGGDVKLLAAIGSLGGSSFVWRVFIVGAIAGGVLAILQLTVQGRLIPVIKQLGFWLWTVLSPGVQPAPLAKLDENRHWGRLPYAVPLSLGVIICWLWW